MDMKQFRLSTLWIIAGDLLSVLIISIIGFASHNEVINWQILTTFLPYTIAWAVNAPWLDVYRPETARKPAQLWRPMLAAFLAAPMAAWLRGAWLNRAILPLFVLVLGLSAALGFFVWRLIWIFISRRMERYG